MSEHIDLLNRLKEPFKENEIHWRVGSVSKAKDKATALAYINARDVMKRLDDVVGIENWSDEYITEPPRTVRKFDKFSKSHYNEQICGRVICKLSIRIDGEWIAKSDGAGETNVEGEKGGISDAFKRAAVRFGIGRYLYYIEPRWLPIDQWKKFIDTPQLPAFAKPKGNK